MGTTEGKDNKGLPLSPSSRGPDQAELAQIKVDYMKSDFYEALKVVNSQLQALEQEIPHHSLDQATASQVAALQAQMGELKQQ